MLTYLAVFAALANDSCQVYPSEYAYESESNSVIRSERSSAKCRQYASGLPAMVGVFTEYYTHCDGTQLRLTDSDLGSEQYSSSDYYVWDAGSSGSQLLFIFPTRVNLTTIILHYYSDNTTTLPRLRFFALPEDFDVWDAPLARYSFVDNPSVPPGGEPAGRRNVSVNINFVSKKVLFYRYRSEFAFAVSELKFFNCTGKQATYSLRIILNYNNIVVMQDIVTEQVDNATTVAMVIKTANSGKVDSCMYFKYAHDAHNLTLSKICIQFVATDSTTIYTTVTDTANSSHTEDQVKTIEIYQTGEHTPQIVATTIGIATAIATVILFLTAMTAIVSFLYLRKSAQKRKACYDTTYSTLCRESGQQMQSQLLHTSSDLYDQIQLSPSTGQAEFISRNETANTNNPPSHQTECGIHPSVDKDKPKSAKLKITASTMSTQEEDKSTSEQPTYAVVNKKKKKKSENESVNCKSQNTAALSQNEGVTEQSAVEQGNYLQESQDSPDTTTQFPSQTIDSPQALYTDVKKKPKDRPVEDKKVPTILPYTTEELYTAVKNKPKASTAGDDEEAPQIPPHTIEELYTAVQKKPLGAKANATVDEEEAPPIPALTVEELYTAVVKKSKASRAEDEEEAPPVPPYTMDEL